MRKHRPLNLKKTRQTVGSEIIQALENAVAYAKGRNQGARVHVVHVPAPVNVKGVRRKLGMSQGDFAASFGISPATLRNWEQGRRQPEGPARVLLAIIDREPEAVQRALRAAGRFSSGRSEVSAEHDRHLAEAFRR
jgi:putative transcriptional regulator